MIFSYSIWVAVHVCIVGRGHIASSDAVTYVYLLPCTVWLRLLRPPHVTEPVDSKPDPPDVLDRNKCLDALAALRHAKWFQVCLHSHFTASLVFSVPVIYCYECVKDGNEKGTKLFEDGSWWEKLPRFTWFRFCFVLTSYLHATFVECFEWSSLYTLYTY